MRDVPAVLWGGLRLLGRHWPALLTLAFIGSGLRAAVTWGAVHVSSGHHVLGQLILIVAPVCYLLAVVAMLGVCRPSLPRLVELGRVTAEDMPSERRPERLVDVAASVLIPFLAVYEAYGLLDQDLEVFRNGAAFDSFSHQTPAFGRLGIYPVHIAVLIVVGAWVLRWGIGLVERTVGLLVLAYVGAAADVFYTVQLALQAVVLRTRGVAWLQDRVAVHWIVSGYDRLVGALGFLGGPFDGVVGFLQAVTASWNAIIVVPIAWLGVGAVVLARKEADEEDESRGSGGAATADQRGPRLPRLLLSLLADVRKRVGALWSALRLMVSAGLLPMLVFSLALLVVIRVPTLISPVVRDAVGPQPTDTWLAVSPIQDTVELALSMVLTVPLVAAAVEWLVGRRLERRGLMTDLDARTGSSPEGSTEAAPLRDADQEAGSVT